MVGDFPKAIVRSLAAVGVVYLQVIAFSQAILLVHVIAVIVAIEVIGDITSSIGPITAAVIGWHWPPATERMKKILAVFSKNVPTYCAK